MNFIKKNIYKKIKRYIVCNTKLNKDDFILGEAPFNSRCHLNSVQKVKENKAEKVILCYAIDKNSDFQCVHFINKNVHGKYIDNTWGWMYEFYNYYFLKEVDESEYNDIGKLLSDVREKIYNANCNFVERLIYKSYELI